MLYRRTMSNNISHAYHLVRKGHVSYPSRKTVENISSADFFETNKHGDPSHWTAFSTEYCCHAWDTFSTFSQSRNRKPAKSIQLASLALNWLQSVWEKTTNFDWLKLNLVSVKLKKRALLVLKAAFESCSWPFCCKNTTVSRRVKICVAFFNPLPLGSQISCQRFWRQGIYDKRIAKIHR